MSSSQPDKRVDPLIHAYRQASELEARISGTGPSAAARAAVLAHARVVAQSAASAEPKLSVSEAVRATPAANEPKPVWRMVAGVVLGLAGMWVYQLTRPTTTGEANVAVMTAPPSATAAAVETTAAAAPAVVSPTPAATKPEATVAVAAPPAALPTPTMRAAPSRDSGAGGAARDAMADAARSETSVARAKVAAPLMKTESPVQVAASPVPTAPNPSATTTIAAAAPTRATSAATSAIPEAATSEPLGEIAVAAVTPADTRKLARAATGAAAAPAAPAAPALATAPPADAFPASAARVIAQSAPADAAMFSAIRVGNVNALRAAMARGANVNARDEAGRGTLQIARERNDAEMVKALESAGAK